MGRGWPLLRRAPARAFQAGPLAGLLIASGALLTGLAAAGPMYGAATAAASLDLRLAAIAKDAPIGQRPSVRVSYTGVPTERALDGLAAIARQIPNLTRGQVTRVGLAWQLDPNHPTPYVSFGDRQDSAVLMYRSGGIEQLQAANPATGSTGATGSGAAGGIWLSEQTAADLGVRPGQDVDVSLAFPLGTGKTKHLQLPLAGTYATRADQRTPTGGTWGRALGDLPTDPDDRRSTARLMIVDEPTFERVSGAIGERPAWWYDADLASRALTPDAVAQTGQAIQRLAQAGTEPGSPVWQLLGPGGQFGVGSGLPALSAQVRADTGAARDQGRGVAYAGGLLGAVAVLTTLRALAQRRDRENELLVGNGTPARVVLGAVVLELLLPALLGAVIGLALTTMVFSYFGPHAGVTPPTLASAARDCGIVVAGTLAVGAVVTWAQLRAAARRLDGRPVSRAGLSWLPLLAGASGLAVVAVLTRPGGSGFADPLTAILPVLLIGTGCAVIARLASAAHSTWHARKSLQANESDHRSRHARTTTPRTGALVLRGLGHTGVAVADLMVVLAAGVGVLAFGLSSASAVRTSIDDKAAVEAGANTSIEIDGSWRQGGSEGPEPYLGDDTTVVWHTTVSLPPRGLSVALLAVDPTQVAAAAAWGHGPVLRQARSALSAFPATVPARDELAHRDDPLPVIAVGDLGRPVGATASLNTAAGIVPLRVVAHAAAFPGLSGSSAGVVVDARTLFPRLGLTDPTSTPVDPSVPDDSTFSAYVWSTHPPDVVRQRLLGDARTKPAATLAQIRRTPSLMAATWAAEYQAFLGWIAAALAGLAVVVAVDRRVARSAAVDLLLRRFGVSALRLTGLRALEFVRLALGSLAIAAAPLGLLLWLLPRLADPAPGQRPGVAGRLAVSALATGLLTLIAVVGAAALAAARRSATLVPAEVLRDDG